MQDAEGHGEVDASSLPISPGLQRALRTYYAWFSELFLQAEAVDRISVTDLRLLDASGVMLWEQLRSELAGVYHVWFYCSEWNERFERPEEFRAMRAGLPT